MKILIVTARFFPEPFAISNIALELHSRGHQVTVLTGVPNYGLWKIYDGYERVREETYFGIKIIRVNERIRKKSIFGLLRNYLSILILFKRKLKHINCDFDVVFSHVISPIFTIDYVGKFCKKNGLPHFHYGLDLWPESLVASGYLKRNSILIKFLSNYCKSIYNSCDLISFASPSAENYLKNELKIFVPFKHIYQPCLTSPPSRNIVFNHEYKKVGKLRILFCGTIAKFNHLQLFIHAIAKYKDCFIFDIVGSGSDFESVKLLVKQLNLEKNIIFHGRVPSEKTVDFYLKSDILFVPLFWNSATSNMIPQKLIEYLMYGRPILGMIKGDGKKLLEDASSINIISDQTIDSLQKSLEKLSNLSCIDLKKCGEENRYYFDSKKEFSLKYVCDSIEDSLADLIKK